MNEFITETPVIVSQYHMFLCIVLGEAARSNSVANQGGNTIELYYFVLEGSSIKRTSFKDFFNIEK